MMTSDTLLRALRVPLYCLLALALAGCGSSSSVSRVDADQQTDLSGRWNDTDAQRVAEDMIDDVLGSAWLQRYEDGRPVLIVGPVRNNTMQHIDEEIFIKDLERELVNSGQVEFVAAQDEREAIRAERSDQQEHATMATAAQMAQETGADFMLLGTISSEVEESLEGDRASMFYVVNLELINIEKNTKAWIGTKKVKKIVEKDQYSL